MCWLERDWIELFSSWQLMTQSWLLKRVPASCHVFLWYYVNIVSNKHCKPAGSIAGWNKIVLLLSVRTDVFLPLYFFFFFFFCKLSALVVYLSECCSLRHTKLCTLNISSSCSLSSLSLSTSHLMRSCRPSKRWTCWEKENQTKKLDRIIISWKTKIIFSKL